MFMDFRAFRPIAHAKWMRKLLGLMLLRKAGFRGLYQLTLQRKRQPFDRDLAGQPAGGPL
jgi:hypothetical protein